MRLLVISAALALLAGCGGGESESGLTTEEVVRGRGQLKGNLVLGLEDTGSRMSRLGKSELSYGEYLPVTCAWIGSGNTREDVLDAATEHVKAEHAVRSWPPEFWIYMRECIHEA